MEEFRRLDENISANKWFLPLVWVAKMIGAGVEDGHILAPTAGTLMKEVGIIRQNLQTLLSYDWLSVSPFWCPDACQKIYKTPAGEFTKLELFFVLIQFAFHVGWFRHYWTQ